jgi:hypothetical protein
MPEAFYCEQPVEIGGETLRLVINFRAIDATEQLVKRNYDEILEDLQKDDALVGLKGKVIWGLLREHHPELSLDHVLPMMRGSTGVKVGLAITQLMQAAFPSEEKAKGKNPRVRGGRSQSSEGNG